MAPAHETSMFLHQDGRDRQGTDSRDGEGVHRGGPVAPGDRSLHHEESSRPTCITPMELLGREAGHQARSRLSAKHLPLMT